MTKLMTPCLALTMFVGTLLAAAPPRTLGLSDLANKPDRWPQTVTLKQDFRFTGGKSAVKGQAVRVLDFKGAQVLVDAGDDLVFELSPKACDLLESANRAWAALTPTQRAVDQRALLADASLWPQKVTCYSAFTMNDGTELPAGGEFDLINIDKQGVTLYSQQARAKVVAAIGETDVIARARQIALTDPSERPSRIARALDGLLVDAEGEPYEGQEVAQAEIYAFYYGASWCGPCKGFSPGFVEFINKVQPNNPKLAVVMMSNDNSDTAMIGYMKEESMPWPAVPHKSLGQSPLLLGYAGSGIPQLVIVDKNGKVLADTYVGGRYLGPQRVVGELTKMLNAGAAR